MTDIPQNATIGNTFDDMLHYIIENASAMKHVPSSRSVQIKS